MANLIHKEILQSYCSPDDDSLARELFVYFKDRVPGRFELARNAILAGRVHDFKFQLHALKNSFLNVGALDVAEECQRLEDQSPDLESAVCLTELDHIFVKFKQAEDELEKILASNLCQPTVIVSMVNKGI